MLIQTIDFDIHNFKMNTTESFKIPATQFNYETVLSMRFSRNIRIAQSFAVDLPAMEKEFKYPIEIMSLSLSCGEEENEIDEIDEMVGTF